MASEAMIVTGVRTPMGDFMGGLPGFPRLS